MFLWDLKSLGARPKSERERTRYGVFDIMLTEHDAEIVRDDEIVKFAQNLSLATMN